MRITHYDDNLLLRFPLRYLVLLFLISLLSYGVEKPNFIIILADDMPYNALSYTGSPEVRTPHIDSLFEQGLACPQAYVTHGVCAPSRAGLMTGRYQARFGYETLSGSPSHAAKVDHGVDINEITIAQLLKTAGYTSAALGKWHLGINKKYQPLQRGFDHQFGFAGGGGPYYDPKTRSHGLIRNGQPAPWPEGAYQTDLMAQEAEDWMKSVAGKPFFLYFAPYAVHAPFEAPPELIPEGKHPMVGMMKSLDMAVGRILKTVEELGQRDNTIIVFLSDNGGVPKVFEHGFTNAPFRGGKATVLDGGVHVPFTCYWPGKIEGNEYLGIVSSLDLLPTFAAAAGISLPNDRDYDGVNLLTQLQRKQKADKKRTLYWRWRNGHAVREGKWKLVWEINWGEFHHLRNKQNLKNPSPTLRPNPNDRFSSLYFKPQLYNLENDPSESKDLSSQYPEIMERLKKKLKSFDAIAKPLSKEELAAWPQP
ncbi:sulfatase-like hydrolase/transferase [Lentisphaera profundi]|uniref:Sulfatase-like hydrolase/transferase n=1 Tax=Lentisphaera profundi TaxID=1658616 RepID=A0ABY7VW14_9BACT|nr:sulfatase-like hydrolase/transferase [Lentisphaera profundi]WDE98420.1 sulfatase-like hydrolase/transferase [Lentisphaera profundi]